MFHTDFKLDYYVSYGPLLYALPIESHEKIIRKYEMDSFADKAYLPLDKEYEKWDIGEEDQGNFKIKTNTNADSWKDLEMEGVFRYMGKSYERTMQPIGNTILRKVTFAINRERKEV